MDPKIQGAIIIIHKTIIAGRQQNSFSKFLTVNNVFSFSFLDSNLRYVLKKYIIDLFIYNYTYTVRIKM